PAPPTGATPQSAAAPPARPEVAKASPPPPPEKAPAEAEEPADLEESLEEVDFFIQQSLFDEAAESLEALAARYPGHPGIRERQEKLRSSQEGAPAAAPETGSFDLAAELEREVSSEPAALALDDEFQYSVEDVFSEFKKGVAKVVEKEDSATHFDLGIAYKEMGLLDDAISEFSVAAADAGRRPTALTMVGLCLLEKNQYSDAINRFKDALHSPGIAEDQATAVYFEMAQAYELLKDKGEALFYFNKVSKRDPKFRDVTERIQKLVQSGAVSRPEAEEPRTPPEPKGAKPPVPPGGRKISYM
ncbi:MAG: tetratricopeptide repeat protein, partial [Myxococcales bacterium]|nr:tetratricopeptide repeat protein [Myxococcales bacterium]